MYTCMTINVYFYCLYGISLRYGNEAVFVCVCVYVHASSCVVWKNNLTRYSSLSLSLCIYTVVHWILSVGVLIDTPLSLSLFLYTPTH